MPVPFKEKGPRTPQWQHLRLTADQVPHYFPEPSNIGVLLGEPSGGIVDIDLDAPEAQRVAPMILPATDCVFGHGNASQSHHIYEVTPIPRTEQFRDVNGSMLVEKRSTGAQTVFPPSTHPSGEVYTFDKEGSPAKVEAQNLYIRVLFLAVYALLARHWPKEGFTPRCGVGVGWRAVGSKIQ